MYPRHVTAQEQAVLADLALTMLSKPAGSKAAMVAAILSGRVNEFEPADFRYIIAALAKHARGSSLDVIGGLFDLHRETTVHADGQFSETDASFSDRLLRRVATPPASAADQLVGVSLRTALHFCPQATLAQQEAAIEKAVKAVRSEIVRTEVDQTFRLNELWLVLRYSCQNFIVDVGEPNRPFEEILLWREGRPEQLVDNYILKPGERLVPEPSIAAPIDIRSARTGTVVTTSLA